jgi:hypothetical protein
MVDSSEWLRIGKLMSSRSAQVLDGDVDEPRTKRFPLLVRVLPFVLHVSLLGMCGVVAAVFVLSPN